MSHFWNTTLLGAALIASLAISPMSMQATDRKNAHTYHDKQRNDDHQWNNHEDQAYRVWVKENHRKSTSFVKLRENDQQAYWGWRHEHSDALLNINIR